MFWSTFPVQEKWPVTRIHTPCWRPETGGHSHRSWTHPQGMVTVILIDLVVLIVKNTFSMGSSAWRVWTKTGTESSEISGTLGEFEQSSKTELGSLWVHWYLSDILRLLLDRSVKYWYFPSHKSLQTRILRKWTFLFWKLWIFCP